MSEEMEKKIPIPDKCEPCAFKICIDTPRAQFGYFCSIYDREILSQVVAKKKKPEWCYASEVIVKENK